MRHDPICAVVGTPGHNQHDADQDPVGHEQAFRGIPAIEMLDEQVENQYAEHVGDQDDR